MRCYFFLPLLALPRELEALAVLLAALLRDAAALVELDLDAEALLALALEVLAALAVDLAGASLGAVALPATTSLKPCPARNRGTLVAFTLTGAPLRGLRAVRALRSCRSKVPKPTSATRSPFLTATWVCWIRLPSTLSTSVRATWVCFWIASTSSLRFKGASLPSKGNSPVGTGPPLGPVPLRPSIVKTWIAKVNTLDPGQSVAAQRHHRLAPGKGEAISLPGNGFALLAPEDLAGCWAFVQVRQAACHPRRRVES